VIGPAPGGRRFLSVKTVDHLSRPFSPNSAPRPGGTRPPRPASSASRPLPGH